MTLSGFLIVGALLFSIGALGVLIRRNAIVMLMSIELMLQGANVTLAAFSKYLDDQSELRIPANLSMELSDKVRDLSVKAFLALGCAGMARVDFLLDPNNENLYLNEVNTLPGFTTISQYPKLWEATGLAYSELLDRLIELALARHHQKNRIEASR